MKQELKIAILALATLLYLFSGHPVWGGVLPICYVLLFRLKEKL